MNETELLALGEALARTTEILRPGERIPFCDYLRRVLGDSEDQIRSLFGNPAFTVSVDGQLVDAPDSTLSVTARSRVVLYRRQGPMLDVLTRGVVRHICLN